MSIPKDQPEENILEKPGEGTGGKSWLDRSQILPWIQSGLLVWGHATTAVPGSWPFRKTPFNRLSLGAVLLHPFEFQNTDPVIHSACEYPAL